MHTYEVNIKTLGTAFVSAMLLFGLCDSPLHAAQNTGDARASAIEEIVVTAQKREESLQDVPIAISAFTKETLAAQNIDSIEDLEELVPGFNFDKYSPGQPRYYIRGIGNNLHSGSVENPVGVFLDGVYLSRSSMAAVPYLNVERIEVMRGPQGTLFGRNVVGGAVSIHTTKPSAEPSAEAELTYGNYDLMSLKGHVGGAISDNVFASLAGIATNRDGYAFNTTTQNDVVDDQMTALQASLMVTPTDNLELLLTADVHRRRGTGGWWMLVHSGDLWTAPSWLLSPWRNNGTEDDGRNDIDNQGFSARITWSTDIGTVTSISAYRKSFFGSRVTMIQPNLPSPPDPSLVVGNLGPMNFFRDFEEDADQISQEIRIASNSGGPLNWVTGIYYFSGDVTYRHDSQSTFAFPFLTGTFYSGSFDSVTTDAVAVFANADYYLTDALRIQLGARWSRDEKENMTIASGNPRGGYTDLAGEPLPDGVGYTVQGKKDWSAFTPMLSVNYKATSNALLYSTVSKGFKSGGFAGAQPDAITAAEPFNPEFVWNYEIGAKTEWFDRVRLNLAAYWMDYTNLQVRGRVPSEENPEQQQWLMLNTGKATIKGVETEISAIVTDNLTLNAMHSYMKSEIEETTGFAAEILRVGDKLIKTPINTYRLAASYRIPLPNDFSVTATAAYAYTGSHYPGLPNNELELIPSQKLVNASVFLDKEDGRWSVQLWAKNLTDEMNLNSPTDVLGSTFGFADPPRTYGVTFHLQM